MKYTITVKRISGKEEEKALVCKECDNTEFDSYTQLVINVGPIITSSTIDKEIIDNDKNRTFYYKCKSCSKVVIFEEPLKVKL